MSYEDFIRAKTAIVLPDGMPDPPSFNYSRNLFPFQEALTRWQLRLGRGLIGCATGLGKTAQQLVFADQVTRYCTRDLHQGHFLLLAPLAVAQQTIREGEKLGIEVRYTRSQSYVKPGITITNYDMLHAFDPAKFDGVGLDEASILKNQDGKTRTAIINAFSHTRFKGEYSATPAPNDYTELGNHCEFLGVMKLTEMLAKFFYHDGGDTSKWCIKGHAETEFWRWVASWGALVNHPRDIGFDQAGYDLPPLHRIDHILDAAPDAAKEQGLLFAEPVKSMREQRKVKRGGIEERVEKVCEIVASKPEEQWLVWCDLNDESTMLRKAIPGAVEIAGSTERTLKEESMIAFADGKIRVLVTKREIAGFGMNWQNCSHMVSADASHKWEMTHQAERRCWRFGQTRPVYVHTVCSELNRRVLENNKRKELAAAVLSEKLKELVGAYVRANIDGKAPRYDDYEAAPHNLPAWLTSAPVQRSVNSPDLQTDHLIIDADAVRVLDERLKGQPHFVATAAPLPSWIGQ